MSIDDYQKMKPDPSTQPDLPEPRRVLKTHAEVKWAPWQQDKDSPGGLTIPDGAKVIVITRNPMDACVSMYHHTKKMPFKYSGDMNHFALKMFKAGNVESNSFWEWHRGWLNVRDCYGEDKFLWLSYEEMMNDSTAGINKIGAFLFPSPPSSEVIEAVSRASSFETMKEATERENEKKVALGERAVNHMREGKSGKWRDALGNEVADDLLAHHIAKCTELEMDPSLWTI